MKWQTIVAATLSTVALIVSVHTLIQVRRQRKRLLEHQRQLRERMYNHVNRT